MAGLIKNPKDFCIGLIYLGIGVAALVLGRGYAFGTGSRMGPGFFPTIIAGLLILFGLIALGRSFVASGSPIGPVAWKSLALVVGAMLVFALLLQRAGLVAAIIALVLISAVASDKFAIGWRPILGLAALVVGCAVVFVVGLGLPIPLVGSSLKAILPAGWG